MSELILASQSPRRAELLEQVGFRFSVVRSAVDESAITIDEPVQHVRELSKMKAFDVSEKIKNGLIIGADTIVFVDSQILGKPGSHQEAKTMLQLLSGKIHQVYTGFTLLEINGQVITTYEKTDVRFRTLAAWEIDDYIATGCPMDKAGAYGIQQRAGLFVEKIEGCYFNVVGFPLSKFFDALQQIWSKEQIAEVMR